MKVLKLIVLAVMFISIICILQINAGTTGKIAGTVVDSENKQPIPARVIIEGTAIGANVSPIDGSYVILDIPAGIYTLIAECVGYKKMTIENVKVEADKTTEQNIELVSNPMQIENITVEAIRPVIDTYEVSTVDRASRVEIAGLLVANNLGGPIDALGGFSARGKMFSDLPPHLRYNNQFNTEAYSKIYENEFKSAFENPVSTFSIDVDAASYSNVRRFINDGKLPPTDAVRIEEFINYFNYDYPQPGDNVPFSITTEMSICPWNKEHRLVHIGLQGWEIATSEFPPGNIVFLLDVSGSMSSPNKLPLLKSSFRLLVEQLRKEDRVAIVVYAGASGLVLQSTPGDQKNIILQAIEILHADGSTAGGAGIKLAYDVARQNFIKGGNNRVILATDGDFNIGPSSDAEMVELIEQKREHGIFLSVLGFGTGNLKDSKMEQLADKGNGNYSYIDNIMEAQKVLVSEMGGTLFTIAKDVKIQIEFNPARVKAYRLIGYENRLLAKEDFNDDTKDAGELGAGHTVTALYEIVPAGSDEKMASVDDLKYQISQIKPDSYDSPEFLTIKFRYKEPDGEKSKLIEQSVIDQDCALAKTSDNFRFSAAVAEWGMLLRNSKFKADADFDQVLDLAKNARGDDEEGYRSEFIKLVKMSGLLAGTIAER